jgi:tRNA pseudouridine13 synthase
VLEARRHPHKLRVGKAGGNHFRLVVRELDEALRPVLVPRLEALTRWGFANRFGRQRFGRFGDNAEIGARLLAGGRRPRDKRAARFAISALQSELFNRQIDRRGELPGMESVGGGLDDAGRRPIDRLVRGDLAVKSDSGGVFEVIDLDAEQSRADQAGIAPSGLLFGRKARVAADQVGALERSVLAERGLDPDCLPRVRGLRFDGGRRSLRVRPTNLEWRFAPSSIELCFELGSGSYATVVLEELFAGLDLIEGGSPRG